MPHTPVPPSSRAFSRAMRRTQTDAEQKLWSILRGRRFCGLKWRRQVPLGAYIVDFLCYERRTIVECDGSQHADNPGDQVRDAWLAEQGFVVARFWNHEVLEMPGMVEDTILARAGLPV